MTVAGNRTDTDAGGGLDVSTSQPTTITNSITSHNTAETDGSGTAYFVGSLTVTGTTAADNRVTGSTDGGGGISFRPLVSCASS